MTVYYIFFAVIFIYNIIISQVKALEEKKKNIGMCILGFLMIFLMLALRHPSMGVDLGWGREKGYLKSFDILNSYSWDKIIEMEKYLNYEKGYVIFNKLIGSVVNNEQFFLGVCAFVAVAPIWLYTYKRSKLPLLSICIYAGLPAFIICFSGLRQSIAIGIIILSIFCIEKHKKVLFVLVVLFASAFHSSAIIFLIAYPLYYVKFNNVTKLIFVMALPVIYLLREPLFVIFSQLFKNDAEIESTGAITLFIVFSLIYLFLIFFADDSDRQQNGLVNLFYMACVCQAFGGVYNTAIRVGYYFMVSLIIVLPNTIMSMKERGISKKNEYQISYMILLFVFVVYGLSALSDRSWAMTNPYHFFWESIT